MNRATILFLGFLAGASMLNGEDEIANIYENARLVWVTESPTCFQDTASLPAYIENMPRYIVGGDITEPTRLSGDDPTIRQLEETGERPWVLVFEVVIGKTGATEAVVSLKPGYPKMEELAAEYFAHWTWEPPTRGDEPVCVRYILTQRIHYY